MQFHEIANTPSGGAPSVPRQLAFSAPGAILEPGTGSKPMLIDRAYLDTRLAALRTELVMWIVGTVGTGTLLNHWWR